MNVLLNTQNQHAVFFSSTFIHKERILQGGLGILKVYPSAMIIELLPQHKQKSLGLFAFSEIC